MEKDNKKDGYEIENTNKTSTDNYDYLKLFRDEVRKIGGIGSKIACPVSDFITLFAKAVCGNVDIFNVCEKIENPNCYLSMKELYTMFHTTSYKKVIEILDNLKNNYDAIDYEEVRKIGYHTFYIKFNISTENIVQEEYSPNELKHAIAVASKENIGFFFVNKKDIYNTFYAKEIERQGVRDLYYLLRLNCVSLDSTKSADEYKDAHIVQWGQTKDKGITFSNDYITYKHLAATLGVQENNIKRFMHSLVRHNMIKNKYWRRKGTIINISYLDKKLKSKSKNCLDLALKRCRELLKGLKEKVIMNSFTSSKHSRVKTIEDCNREESLEELSY